MLLCLGGRNVLVKILALLGCYEAWTVVSYQTFRASLSVPFPKVKQSKEMTLESGPDSLSAMSVTNYQSTLRNIPEDGKSRVHRSGSLKSRM